jgi:putative membrane protein
MFTTLATHSHGWGWGPGPWVLFFPLFWLTLIGFVIWRFRRGGPPWRYHDTGRSVLDEMYARGEVDADEYRARRDVLQEGRR